MDKLSKEYWFNDFNASARAGHDTTALAKLRELKSNATKTKNQPELVS